jgi:pimeloyl-ACP methyl ester carboxylesterase
VAGNDLGVWAGLKDVNKAVLYANGTHDVMIRAYGSYAAIQRLPIAELVLYSGAGHAFLFQHYARFGRRVLDLLAASDQELAPGSP